MNDCCWYCVYYERLHLGEDDTSESYFANCSNDKSDTHKRLAVLDEDDFQGRRCVMWSHKKICNLFKARECCGKK